MSGHKHHWVLVRTAKSGKKTIHFFECVNPGCPNPHKAEVK